MLPKIAIVGRPNVGKSSIMNMLAGRKVSITDDTPGTTRDRVSAEVLLDPGVEGQAPILAEIIDTGGYGVYVASGRRIDDAGKDLSALTKDIEGQIAKAVQNADLILFVIDAQAGVTALDETVARLLRQGGLGAIDEKGRTNAPAGSKVAMLANKCDGPRWESHAAEAAGLGFGEPLMCSAKNNYMRRELVERLYDLVVPIQKKIKKAKKDTLQPPEMKLAIVGKRNAGKSTLVNTLAGEKRVIVSEIAGTTRDAIDVRFDFGGRAMVAIDTAGLRRKKSFADRIEWWALERMQMAIDRADVALLMIDATEPISHVDHQVAAMLTKSYKPCAIVVNKWDLVKGKQVAGGKKGQKVTPEHYETYLRENLKGLWYAPIAFISADKNTNVNETIDLAFEMNQQSATRVTTGKLNRIVRAIIDEHKPSSKTGLMAKVYYVAQITTNPPTVVLVVNQPVMYTPAYTRFLLNRMREELPFSEVPIKLLIRDRKRHEQIVARRGEHGTADNEPGTLELDIQPAETYFDEPTPAKGRAAPLQPASEDDEPALSEAEAVATFSDAPVQRKSAPFNPKKPRPAAMEAKARSKKRAKGRPAN